MFRISKDAWLKKDILELLDKQPDFMLTADVVDTLNQRSLATIQKNVKFSKKKYKKFTILAMLNLLSINEMGYVLFAIQQIYKVLLKVYLQRKCPINYLKP